MDGLTQAESWAAAGARADNATDDGSDPRRGGQAPRLKVVRPGDELGDVTEVRIVADHDDPGGLYVLVFGSSSVVPMLSWPVSRQFVDELRGDESAAMVRCRSGHRHAQLLTPPGRLPHFFAPLEG